MLPPASLACAALYGKGNAAEFDEEYASEADKQDELVQQGAFLDRNDPECVPQLI